MNLCGLFTAEVSCLVLLSRSDEWRRTERDRTVHDRIGQGRTG